MQNFNGRHLDNSMEFLAPTWRIVCYDTASMVLALLSVVYSCVQKWLPIQPWLYLIYTWPSALVLAVFYTDPQRIPPLSPRTDDPHSLLLVLGLGTQQNNVLTRTFDSGSAGYSHDYNIFFVNVRLNTFQKRQKQTFLEHIRGKGAPLNCNSEP